jgi:hypothetical protein
MHLGSGHAAPLFVELLFMRVQLRLLARLGHHLVSLEGVQIVERRQAVEVHLVTKVVLLAVKHVWLVHEVSAGGHVCVVGRHRGPVSAVAPEVRDLLQAIDELVPLLVEEVSLHCLLVLLPHLAFKELHCVN